MSFLPQLLASGPWLVGLLAAAAVVMLGAALATGARGPEPVRRRLQELGGSPGRRQALAGGLRRLLTRLLSRLAAPAKPRQGWQASKLRQDLVAAGYRGPQALNIFLGLRVVFCLVAPPLLLTLPAVQKLPPLGLFGALAAGAWSCFLLPGFWLEGRIKNRRRRITRELPEVLDLLVIGVEAGLGLDAAVKRVAREVSLSCPVLSQELKLMALELKVGIPRQMALKNLAQRTACDQVSSLVTMLIQADRFGVSVGRSLRIHSETVRTKRRQQLEEQAAKVPLKLLFPVLFLIFPAIMAVMAGPAIIKVSESILK